MTKPNTYRILIAEDDNPSFELLQIYLEDYNVDIVHVENGKDLLDCVYKEPFDVVITDNRMPLLSGLEVIELVRKSDSLTPFIAVSGNIFEEDKEACLNAGFNGYLHKPIKPEVLIEELQKHLPLLVKF